jgi:tyrosyl-tRNA synthetase
MMWRFYELLTDVSMAEIAKMRDGMHPMQAKKDLAVRIVTDFHSADAAATAAEGWAKQFQKDEVPEEIETVEVAIAQVAAEAKGDARKIAGGSDARTVRIDKLVKQAGLAASNTEASAKVKGGAVEISGEKIGPNELVVALPVGEPVVLRVGRRMKRVRLVG